MVKDNPVVLPYPPLTGSTHEVAAFRTNQAPREAAPPLPMGLTPTPSPDAKQERGSAEKKISYSNVGTRRQNQECGHAGRKGIQEHVPIYGK